MPPKAAAGEKTYDAAIVIALLMQIKSLGGSYTKSLADMATLDGKRSTSAFEHSLRAANKLANELVDKQKKGEQLGPEHLGRPATEAAVAANTQKKRKDVVETAGDEDVAAPAKKRGRPAKKSAKHVAEDEENGGDLVKKEVE